MCPRGRPRTARPAAPDWPPSPRCCARSSARVWRRTASATCSGTLLFSSSSLSGPTLNGRCRSRYVSVGGRPDAGQVQSWPAQHHRRRIRRAVVVRRVVARSAGHAAPMPTGWHRRKCAHQAAPWPTVAPPADAPGAADTDSRQWPASAAASPSCACRGRRHGKQDEQRRQRTSAWRRLQEVAGIRIDVHRRDPMRAP